MRTARAAAFAAAFCFAAAAMADSWPNATIQAAASENGDFVVRMTPGESIGDTHGFAGAPKGRFASAQWFRFRDGHYEPLQRTTLVNPVGPLQLAVANDGTLVTLDNWHNVGFGYVVVIYGPDGQLRRRYRLDDLYAAAAVEKLDRSVSSIWWRCVGDAVHVARPGTLRVDDTLGGRFTFQLTSGEYRYEAGAGNCKRR